MRLSVIIPTYNRRKVLACTLDALCAQELPADDYEILVAVDGSTDGTLEWLQSWKPPCALRVLKTEHRGAAAARNAGLRAATGELVLFLDDDLIAHPSLLRLHCEAHGVQPRVVHGPIYVGSGSSPTIIRHVTETFYERYYRPLDPAMELQYPQEIANSLAVVSSLVNSSMPRELILKCGGFDEEILAAEDLELGLRLWKAGACFRYLPRAAVEEMHIKSSWSYLRGQARALGAGELRASRKHSEYRACSQLAALAETRPWKKWVRDMLMRSPLSPIPLLVLPLLPERWLYRFGAYRSFGFRLLNAAETVVRWRSSVQAAGSFAALSSEFDRKLPVLMYHCVGPSHPGAHDFLAISPEKFELQMRWLRRLGYVGITPREWLRWLREGKGLPSKPVLISFDDAYGDIAEYALPVLERMGFRAAVFVVTGRVGATNAWDEAEGCTPLPLMTAAQIRDWAAKGIEFGAHSRTHADLTKLSAAELESEVAGSKRDLEELLGAPVISFAYPYGEHNDAACGMVSEHFELGFSTDEGMNYLRGDRALLRRAYVGPQDSLAEFVLTVRRGGLQSLRDLRARIGLRSRLRRAWHSLLPGRRLRSSAKT